MIKQTMVRGALAAVLAVAAFSGVAHAGDAGQKWVAVNNAKVTLVQAIQIAEQHHAGSKAVKADLDAKRNASDYYEIDVVNADKKAYEVRVDAETGKVLSSRED